MTRFFDDATVEITTTRSIDLAYSNMTINKLSILTKISTTASASLGNIVMLMTTIDYLLQPQPHSAALHSTTIILYYNIIQQYTIQSRQASTITSTMSASSRPDKDQTNASWYLPVLLVGTKALLHSPLVLLSFSGPAGRCSEERE
jgi:hypothetical protein